MELISSTNTFLHKWVIPLGAAFFVAVLILGPLVEPPKPDESRIAKAAGPVLMAVVLWVVMRRRNLSLADEVYDLGDALLVKKGGREARILLQNIASLTTTRGRGTPPVILGLVSPCELGSEIVFIPGRGAPLTTACGVVDDLRRRIGSR